MSGALVVGNIMVDIVAPTPNPPEPGSTLYTFVDICPGGGALNVAFYARKLGAEVHLVGCVGNDPMGHMLLEFMKSHGIDFVGSVVDGITTGIVLAFVWPRERSFIVDPGANRRLDPKIVAEALDLVNPDVVFVHCYGLDDPLQAGGLLEAIRIASRRGILVALDPAERSAAHKLRKLGDILRLVDTLTPNRVEALELSGDTNVVSAAKKLAAYGCRVVIKMDKDGALVSEGDTLEFIAPHTPPRVISPAGAGDAFDAAILYGLLNNMRLRDAAVIGNQLASRVLACTCALCLEAVEDAPPPTHTY